MEELERLYTYTEAMEYLRVSRSTLYRMLMKGRIDADKVGCAYRFTKQQMDAARQPAMPPQPYILRREQVM